MEGQIWAEVAVGGHAVLLSAPQPSETGITSQSWHSFPLISVHGILQARILEWVATTDKATVNK